METDLMPASTDGSLRCALAYPPEEIEQDLAAFSARRISLTSPEWRTLVSQEIRSRNIRARYWFNRLLGWTMSRRKHKRVVKEIYNSIWKDLNFTNFVDPAMQRMPHKWRGEGFMLNSAATQKLHHALMIKALRFLRPESALEVGSGSGINLVVLASQCPVTRFQGIELTQNGVDLTNALVAAEKLPQSLQDFMTEPPLAPSGFRTVTVDLGSAERLPYADDSFDVVITRLALEQMESIRDQALTEISRVARSYVLLVESFREANDKGLPRQYAIGNRYFRGAIADLPRFRLEPIFTFSDWPHKITLHPVFVLAKKMHTKYGGRS